MRYQFIDREMELNILEKEYRSKGTRLVIVYGRRRIGKTFLLNKFASNKKHLFYIAIESSKNIIYRDISNKISTLLGKPIGLLENIEQALELLTREFKDRFLVVLDEFQYIVEADPETPSRLQRFIDLNPNTNLVIVLSGSAVSFFEKQLLGYKSPLFGRRTASIQLKPLRFLDTWRFYEKYSALEALKAYAAFGPTPAYARYVNDDLDVFSNILDNILRPGSYLYDEALNFMRQEFREPSTYVAIINGVVDGYTRPVELANIARITSKTITKYIEVLEKLFIIERVYSLGRRRGNVQIEVIDPYFYFWFKYVKPYMNQLESGDEERVLEIVEKTYNEYLARIVETLVRRELLLDAISLNLINAETGRVGKWWYKGEEIDVVITGRNMCLFAEVKWSGMSKQEALREARILEAKASRTGLQKSVNKYAVVARRIEGIRKPVEEKQQYVLVDLLRLLETLKQKHTMS